MVVKMILLRGPRPRQAAYEIAPVTTFPITRLRELSPGAHSRRRRHRRRNRRLSSHYSNPPLLSSRDFNIGVRLVQGVINFVGVPGVIGVI